MRNFKDELVGFIVLTLGAVYVILGQYAFFWGSGEYSELQQVVQIFFVFISIVFLLMIPFKNVRNDDTNFEFKQDISMSTKIKGRNIKPKEFENLTQKIGCNNQSSEEISSDEEIELAKIKAETERIKIEAMLEKVRIDLEKEKLNAKMELFKILSKEKLVESKKLVDIQSLMKNANMSTPEKLSLLKLLISTNNADKKLLK